MFEPESAEGIDFLAGDTVKVYIGHGDASAQTLEEAWLVIEMVDRSEQRAPSGDPYSQLVLSHEPIAYWRLAGLTAVDISGTQTVTEEGGVLSVKFQDQTANDINTRLKAHTFAVGDSFVVPVRLFERTAENFCMAVLVFTDGTASTSNATAAFVYLQTGATGLIIENRSGTLTNMATATGLASPTGG